MAKQQPLLGRKAQNLTKSNLKQLKQLFEKNELVLFHLSAAKFYFLATYLYKQLSRSLHQIVQEKDHTQTNRKANVCHEDEVWTHV